MTAVFKLLATVSHQTSQTKTTCHSQQHTWSHLPLSEHADSARIQHLQLPSLTLQGWQGGNGGAIIWVIGALRVNKVLMLKKAGSTLDPKVWLANTTDRFSTCILSPLRHAYM